MEISPLTCRRDRASSLRWMLSLINSSISSTLNPTRSFSLSAVEILTRVLDHVAALEFAPGRRVRAAEIFRSRYSANCNQGIRGSNRSRDVSRPPVLPPCPVSASISDCAQPVYIPLGVAPDIEAEHQDRLPGIGKAGALRDRTVSACNAGFLGRWLRGCVFRRLGPDFFEDRRDLDPLDREGAFQRRVDAVQAQWSFPRTPSCP